MSATTRKRALPPATPEEAPAELAPLRMTPATFMHVELDRISESKTNPRRTFHGIDELAASIREKGIIEPLIVRPTYTTRTGAYISSESFEETLAAMPGLRNSMLFNLVAGARRYRAAKKAGIETVPCIMREYTDVQACEVQVIENNQREDVHPLEEAAGFAHLVELGQDPIAIAGKIGRPEAYVTRRLQLTKLIDSARKLFESEKISLGHAVELCRLSESAQTRAMRYINDSIRGWSKVVPPVSELRRNIGNDSMRELSSARWKHDDVELVPEAGACATCMKNTSNQRALFDDVDPKKPHCTDPECFESKAAAFVQISIKRLTDAGEKPVLVCDTHDRKSLAKRFGQDVHSRYSFQEISAKQAKTLNGKAQKAVMVDGDEPGRVIFVSKDDVVAGRSESAADKRYRAEQKRRQEKTRLATIANTRILDECLRSANRESLREANILRLVLPQFFDRLFNDYQKVLLKRHGWQPSKKDRYASQQKAFNAQLEGITDTVSLARLVIEIALLSSTKPSVYASERDGDKVIDAASEAFGVNATSIRKQVAAEQKPGQKSSKAKKVPA